MSGRNQRLKALLRERQAPLVPGVANALAARLVEDMGFAAIYLSGAGVTNSFLGLPDLGFIGLADIAQHTAAVRQAVDLPLIVDVDTGFGNALNVHHTVQTLERAWANAIQIEDQVSPKKCGHFAGKEIVSRDEAVTRVRAAVAARRDPDFQIIARTDARAVAGLDEAIARARAFEAAGADVIFIEAPENHDEIAAIARAVEAPQLLNLVVGGKTPMLTQTEARELGFGLVLYANLALQAAVAGMRAALGRLQADGRVDDGDDGVASFADRQRLVRKDVYDDLERRFAKPG